MLELLVGQMSVILLGVVGWLAYKNEFFLIPDLRDTREQELAKKDERLNDLEDQHEKKEKRCCDLEKSLSESKRQQRIMEDDLEAKCTAVQMSLKQSQRDLEDSQIDINRLKRSRRDGDFLDDVIALRGPAHYAHEGRDTHRRCGNRRCDLHWRPSNCSRYNDDDDGDPLPDCPCRRINDPRRHEDSKERKQREAKQQQENDEQVRKMKQKHGEDLENREAKIKKANQVIADVELENGQLRKEHVTLRQDLEKNGRAIVELKRKNRDLESLASRNYQQPRNDRGVNQMRQTAVLESEDNHENDHSEDEPLTRSAARNGAKSTGEELDDQRVESQPVALLAAPNDIALSHQDGGVSNGDDLTPAQGSADVAMQIPAPAQGSADVDMQIPVPVPVPQMPSMRSRNRSLHRSFSWPSRSVFELCDVEPRSRTVSSISGSVSSIPSVHLESTLSALSEEGH